MTAPKPVILGIDEDRAAQAGIAQAFNGQGVFYRFITDRKKLAGGLRQLKPDLLVLFGALSSDFAIQVLDTVAADVEFANLPVVVVTDDISDQPFVEGLRSGVVAMFQAPFNFAYVLELQAMWNELPSRQGIASGTGDSKQIQRVVDHIRRTRRTGSLIIDARSPIEGRAAFLKGKLQTASRGKAVGPDALKAMLALSKANWSFSDGAGQSGDGAGVVIEVGGDDDGEEVIVGAEEVVEEPVAEVIEDRFEVSPPAPTAPVVPASSPSAEAARPVRLLMVDDDEALLRMFSTLFTKHGFQVTVASDGNQGVDVALQRDFDLVLADLNMPHLDGWGMLRVLRDDFRTRELPVAFISAHDDYRESLKALNAGAQAYLSKGTRLDSLVAQAKKLLEPRQATLAQLSLGQAFSLSIATVGPQWFLRQISLRYLSGRLEVKDGWATYQLSINGGACIHATATAGKYTAEAERAINAFIASRAAEGTWIPGAQPSQPQNLFLSTEMLLERACASLNENERRVRENLLITGTQIDVNEGLYNVYKQVGPKQYLEAARLICEEKMPARDVIGKLDMSPVDIEETMKDLIRRGVVTLKRPQ